MKILVGKMPKETRECPFAKAEDTIRGYYCIIIANKSVWDASCELSCEAGCPFLKEVK